MDHLDEKVEKIKCRPPSAAGPISSKSDTTGSKRYSRGVIFSTLLMGSELDRPKNAYAPDRRKFQGVWEYFVKLDRFID